MKIIAKKNFTLKGKLYTKGKEVKNIDIEILNRLNENGFIEPINIKNYIENLKIKKGDDNNGTII